jgi:hypothetical protein
LLAAIDLGEISLDTFHRVQHGRAEVEVYFFIGLFAILMLYWEWDAAEAEEEG